MPTPDHKDPSLYSAIFVQQTRQFAQSIGTLLGQAREVMTVDQWFDWVEKLPIPVERINALIEYSEEESALAPVVGPKATTLVWGPQRRSDLPYLRD